MSARVEPHTLDDLLAAAEARIQRLSPAESHAAMRGGALLIDIRSGDSRERSGTVPGALHIPRTVLEWRTAPDSGFRNPHLGGIDQRVILICDHGCSSALAAAVLNELGYARVGDVIGGFEAWRDAGLPVGSARTVGRDPGGPAGMGPPDP